MPGVLMQSCIGLLAIIVTLPVVWFLSRDVGLLIPSVMYGLATIAYLIIAVPISIYRGLDRMEWGLVFTLSGFITVVLMVCVLVLDLGFEATFATYALSQVVALTIVFPIARRGLPENGEYGSRSLTLQLWRMSVTLWGVSIFQSLNWRVGLVAVQVFSGSYELGIYNAAAKLVENLRVIPWFLLMAILPTFAQRAKTQPDLVKPLLERALRYVLLLAFPLIAILTLLAPKIMDLIYASDFLPSIPVFMIAVAGLVPLFAHWVFFNAMISLNMERALIFTYLISILVVSTLNAVFIPVWGVIGAAVGYVIGEFVVALVSGFFVTRALGGLSLGALIRIAVPGLAVVMLAWFRIPHINVWIWVGMVCLGYILSVFLFRAISLTELRDLIRHRPISVPMDE